MQMNFWQHCARWMTVTLIVGPLLAPGQTSAQDVDLTQTMTALVDKTIQALDMWWTPWFLAQGLEEPIVSFYLIQPGESVRTNCGIDGPRSISGDENNAMYCDLDTGYVNGIEQQGVIYIPVGPLVEMLAGDMWDHGSIDEPFNFTLFPIVAHEFSHHVTFEISSQSLVPLPGFPRIELLADCLAGSFMLVLNQIARLSEPQLNAILQGLALIADPSGGTGSHGTAEQRQTAFLTGFNGPVGADTRMDCLLNYWIEFFV